MSADTHTIPDHIVARVERLINEAEDMRQQAADSLKQTYADLRDELRGMGWAGSTISAEVAALKGAIAELRLDEKEVAKREAKGDRIGDYVSMVSRARAREGRSYAEEKGREHPITPSSGNIFVDLGFTAEEGREIVASKTREHQTATGTEQGHVESSAERASGAVRVGATNSPDGQQGSVQPPVSAVGCAPAESASDAISATISPDPHLPLVDGGQPDQSLDNAGAKSDGPHSIVGQGGHEPGIHSGKSGQQSASAAQDRNGPVSASGASATPFNNPRCQHSDTCHYAHSENACHECLLAWASRPRDEQVRLWAEARAA